MSNREKTEARAERRRSRSIKKVIILVAVLAGIAGLVFFLASGEPDETDKTVGGEIPVVTADDWIKWDADSPVTLIEYSDFQCPACGEYYKLLKAVEPEYGDKVRFVYRHYPLSQIHFNANAAARAAEAAGLQGKFWEMHDRIFETQELWSSMSASDASAVFAGYARDLLRIDVDRYLVDFDSDAVQAKVTEDFAGGLRAGVNATPTFYLNGEKIRNPSDIAEFRAVLDEALANVEPTGQ